MTIAPVLPIRPDLTPTVRYVVKPPSREPYPAISPDRVWSYKGWDTDQDGTLICVTHRPTGVTREFRTVQDAFNWTGSPTALKDLVGLAFDWLRPGAFALPEQRDDAVRALRHFGELLPAGAEIAARCSCGGFLAEQTGTDSYVHVWTCVEEETDGVCPKGDILRHRVCPSPVAVQCDHHRCQSVNSAGPDAQPCEHGHGACCGCCNR